MRMIFRAMASGGGNEKALLMFLVMVISIISLLKFLLMLMQIILGLSVI